MKILVDEVLQAFESHGNIHVIFGVDSGLENEQGNIKDPQVTLIIPAVCASNVAKDLLKASEEFCSASSNQKKLDPVDEKKSRESLGAPISVNQKSS